jgi:hypothetical protein
MISTRSSFIVTVTVTRIDQEEVSNILLEYRRRDKYNDNDSDNTSNNNRNVFNSSFTTTLWCLTMVKNSNNKHTSNAKK